jgi:hypothetical protein
MSTAGVTSSMRGTIRLPAAIARRMSRSSSDASASP